MRTAKLAFIGGGNMCRAIVSGLIQDGYAKNAIWVVDPNEHKRQYFESQLGVHSTETASEAVEAADIVILAVKPQAMEGVAKQVGKLITTKQPLLISIASGIAIKDMHIWFGHDTPIIRCMPNTPSLVQAGIAGLFAADTVSSQQKELAERIIRAVGMVVWLEQESDIDTVICLSGSAPGYFFKIMETMQQIGVEMGLDAKTARLLVLQGAFGSAKLALESQEDLAVLREQVTSKGGTTQAALDTFAKADLDGTLQQALYAAKERSEAIGKTFGAKRHLTNDSEESS